MATRMPWIAAALPARCLLTIAVLFSSLLAHADGGFVWQKDVDIREPLQKANILYDQGREDLIL
jgi:hypothetical protein